MSIVSPRAVSIVLSRLASRWVLAGLVAIALGFAAWLLPLRTTVAALLEHVRGLGPWGLSLIGLEFGLVVGLGIGVLSFIPYVGSIIGLITAVGIALAQFPSWGPVGLVLGLFALGQILEGYVLTPRLVGNRVGLHPVWVIFALLAGGALFGFVGLLLAVPSAAVIGVLTRFAVARTFHTRKFQP